MQLVEIVETNVRFHLSQDKTSQCIVMIVFLIIDQKEVTAVAEEADLAETAVAEDLVVEEAVEVALEIEDHVKCTKLPVQNVEPNVKFHSNQMAKNQFIVMTAFPVTN